MSQGVLAREVLRLKQARDELLNSAYFLKAKEDAKALERLSVLLHFYVFEILTMNLNSERLCTCGQRRWKKSRSLARR